MKKICLFILMLLPVFYLNAQSYDVLNYYYNNTPTYGVKIKTSIPFADGTHMPAIRIEGFNYATGRSIGLSLVYYVYYSQFYIAGASSWGGYTPEIYLTNENGYVNIFINDKSYFQRFKVSVFSTGMLETSSWFTGWTAVDEAIGGSVQQKVAYYNAFKDIEISGTVGLNRTSDGTKLFTYDPGTSKRVIAVLRGVQGNEPNLPTTFGVPYVSIGGTEYTTGAIQTIGFGYNTNGSKQPAEIGFVTKATSGKTYGDLVFAVRANDLNEAPAEVVRIASNGNMGIGTALPSEKLTVNGNIKARKLIVTQSNWPDYVFHPSYVLRPLSEVKTFIQKNRHLPGLPSAKDIEKDGVNIGEQQSLLLKKVEELTLYLLEQNDKIEKLTKELDYLKNRKK